MPLLSAQCVDLPSPSCDALNAFAEHLRCEAMDALSCCFVSGTCEEYIRSYVSMGQGDDGIADTLTVAVDVMNPSPATTATGFSVWIMSFDVRLRESGYPMAQTDGAGRVILPDPELQARATRQSMSHGEAIHRRLSALKTGRRLAPDGYQCLPGEIGTMRPLSPLGGTVGWAIEVAVPMPWN